MYDLLLTDLVLPGIDGVVLATRLRARLGPIPILAVSGYPPDSLRQADLESLKAVLLGKPFSREELLGGIEQAFGRPRSGFSTSELRRGSVAPDPTTRDDRPLG
jgi:CheY-like chemotaxis protein